MRTFDRKQTATGESVIRDDIKSSILLDMCKGKLREHFELDFNRLKTYGEMKLEVESYIKRKGDQDDEQMDLSAMPTVRCHNCGKLGHLKKHCRAPGGGAYQGTQGNSGGKGYGNDSFQGYCSTCFRWDHKSADCPFNQTPSYTPSGKGKGK